MLDIKFIRENTDLIIQNCEDRRTKVDIHSLLKLDDQRKTHQQLLDSKRSELKSSSKSKPTPEQIAELKNLSQSIKELEEEERLILEKFNDELSKVPNLTHKDSPIGEEADFNVLYKNMEPKEFSFTPKDHLELFEKKGLIDFERGSKVAGHKTYFVKNQLVQLNNALIQYGISVLAKNGITDIYETPDFALKSMLQNAGFNPRGNSDEIYNIEGEELSLIATSEITMLGFYSDEIVDLSNGPKIFAAISKCFRKEAGSYGRTSKGLYRVHQFSKLEIFAICKPEDSEKVHDQIKNIELEIADGLEIPYQLIDIASADLGGPAYRKFDIEAYMIMKGDDQKQGDYGEITSTSNCLDYQARRANIKYVDENGKKQFVHTLNGTAIVTSRLPIALAEYHQDENGNINIPKALQPFLNFTQI